MADNAYKLFTDGSCLGNPGCGGTGVCIKFPEEFNLEDYRDYRGYHSTTNNRMELRAGVEGLKAVREKMKSYGRRPVEWSTDSSYVVDNLLYVERWIRDGGLRVNGEPVLNIDLWRELLSLCRSMRILPVWISRELNKEADSLARKGSAWPTHIDFGYNPGRVGRSLKGKGKAPILFDKDGPVLVRIYKGDGEVLKRDSKCKIRFELIDTNGGIPKESYYAYAAIEIYNDLHRGNEYLLSILDGNIVDIIEEL